MNARHLKPCSNIAEYVDWILVIENYHVTNPFCLPLFANGLPTLLFTSEKGVIKHKTTNNLILFGQTIRPQSLTMAENFKLIAYFFKPITLLSLFGVEAQELTDETIDLDLLMPKATFELQERLLNSCNTGDMLRLLDDYIVQLITKRKYDNAIARYATGAIVTQPHKEILQRVQKELNLTERTFQRMFEKNIGLTPNMYRRVCQFNAAFHQLNTGKYTKLTDIAFDNGYADQSHYIRAFKEFTNLTPKEYLNF